MHSLKSELAHRTVIDTAAMDWTASPIPGVWRKRLELLGAVESGRVTSIVRYDPDSAFSSHDHPDGEEILVLQGTFSDQLGDYPAGSYLLNPTGFRHAPFSKAGCLLFVKLRQYGGLDRERLSLNTHTLPWVASSTPGIQLKLLYAHPNYSEQMRLEQWQPGTHLEQQLLGNQEILVLDGSIADEAGHYTSGAWLRQSSGSSSLTSQTGCQLYVKTS
jgi:anti-sigma factor ChrR (cupin superfamily)